MTNKKSILKILLCGFLAVILSIPFGIGIVSADTLTLAKLLEDYSSQEITSSALTEFTTDFGDVSETETITDWTTPTYNKKDGVTSLLTNDVVPFGTNNAANPNTVSVVDLTATSKYYYGSTMIENALGTDETQNNKYGLLLMTSSAGVLGAESSTFTIPANKIYVLTFSAKIFEVSNSKGLNAKIIDKTNVKTYTMSAIKSKTSSYTTYSFLIRGNEYVDTSIALQLLWGSITEGTTENTANNEIGYAVVDTIRLFNVTTAQYNDLASVTATNTKVDLYSSNQSYAGITNGTFSISNVNELGNSTKINDFTPYGWTQETVVTDENNRIAHYGLIDVNSETFESRKGELNHGNLINPGFPVPSNLISHNNVLLLLNESATWQTITSSQTTLTKDSYYEISFSFNTPSTGLENQSNSLSFYVVDADGVQIYKSENVFSYLENTGSNKDWTTFKVFIKTPTTDKKVNFVIKFGTTDSTKSGYVYVDDIILTKKASADVMFENTLENKYLLTTPEGEEATYLAKGAIKFSDLKELDLSSASNRGFSIYDYTTAVIDTPTDEEEADEEGKDDDNNETTPGSSISYLWYVIPSILLGVCTILGLIVFYGRKLKSKVKLPKRAKKNSYDRKKTLEKQVSQREKAEIKGKADAEKQLKFVKAEIEKLEASYAKVKTNPLALKEYVKRRERLQNREVKLLDVINKK